MNYNEKIQTKDAKAAFPVRSNARLSSSQSNEVPRKPAWAQRSLQCVAKAPERYSLLGIQLVYISPIYSQDHWISEYIHCIDYAWIFFVRIWFDIYIYIWYLYVWANHWMQIWPDIGPTRLFLAICSFSHMAPMLYQEASRRARETSPRPLNISTNWRSSGGSCVKNEKPSSKHTSKTETYNKSTHLLLKFRFLPVRNLHVPLHQ